MGPSGQGMGGTLGSYLRVGASTTGDVESRVVERSRLSQGGVRRQHVEGFTQG